MKSVWLGILVTALAAPCCAQTDSVHSSNHAIGLIVANNHHTFLKQEKARIAAAGTLITYGVLSLNSDWFRDWNETAKYEIWTEHPHRIVHIDNYLPVVPAAAVYALNVAGIHGEHGFKDRTFIYVISSALMGSSVQLTKMVSEELRPDGSNKSSFPSGHTAAAFAGAEFLRKEYENVSPWYGVAGYVVATATGYLRVFNNRHWLGDIAAGAAFGILSTDAAYWAYPKIKNWLSRSHRRRESFAAVEIF